MANSVIYAARDFVFNSRRETIRERNMRIKKEIMARLRTVILTRTVRVVWEMATPLRDWKKVIA